MFDTRNIGWPLLAVAALCLLAPGVARKYRQTVLSPGGSKPAADLVKDFLGRPFNAKAWEEWLNRQSQ